MLHLFEYSIRYNFQKNMSRLPAATKWRHSQDWHGRNGMNIAALQQYLSVKPLGVGGQGP